jgi:hypothetical protein
MELLLGFVFVAGVVTYVLVSRSKRKKSDGTGTRPGVRPPTKLD